MKKPILSKSQLCAMFGCTMESRNNQYSANAVQLEQISKTAAKLGAGKKYRGQTAEEWAADASRIKTIAASSN